MDWAGHRHAAKASPYRLNIVESTCKPDNFSTTTNRETEFGQRELFTTDSPSAVRRYQGQVGESVASSNMQEPQGVGGGSKPIRSPSPPRLWSLSPSSSILPADLPEHCPEEGGSPSCSNGSCRPDGRRSSSSPTPAQPTSSSPESTNMPPRSVGQESLQVDHHGEREGQHQVQEQLQQQQPRHHLHHLQLHTGGAGSGSTSPTSGRSRGEPEAKSSSTSSGRSSGSKKQEAPTKENRDYFM